MGTSTGQKFIVTGAAGFIGCNIVAALNARGFDDVLAVDTLDCQGKEENLKSVDYSEYLDRDDFRHLMLDGKLEPVTTVFHMGACSSTTETNRKFLDDNNNLYTRQLCEWSLKSGTRFVYASSAATYGDGSLGYSDEDELTPKLKPLNLYGKSKQSFDTWALKKGLFGRMVGLKFFNVYGPHEDHKGDMRSVINKAYGQILRTGSVSLFKSYKSEYRDGEQDRDFIYVRDAVDVCLYFHDNPKIPGLFNCGTGKARTWLDLVKAVFKAMNREPDITFIDMPREIRDKYQYHTEADMRKLRRAGYKAEFTSLEDGVRDYVRYLAARPYVADQPAQQK